MSTKFLLDENIPFALTEFLDKRGYPVEHLKKIGKGGIKNGDVYNYAESNRMWIITRDADFQSYYKFVSYDISGIILIKLTITRTPHLLETLKDVLDKYKDKLSRKHLIIIEDEVVRIY